MNLVPAQQNVKAFHAHLYYQDEQGVETAKAVAAQAVTLFDIKVGRFHQQAVGPHPVWSCQLSFRAEHFGEVVTWLMLNRRTLDVFLHPVTGDDYFDHTQGCGWLGRSYELDLSQFSPSNP